MIRIIVIFPQSTSSFPRARWIMVPKIASPSIRLIQVVAPSSWNYLFDAPRIRAHGIKLPWDKIIDLMWGVHWYQSDVPKGLGFWGSLLSPLDEWKSQGETRPEFYSCADADAPSHIGNNLYDLLQEEGRWDAFLREWREPEEIFLHMGRGEHSGR